MGVPAFYLSGCTVEVVVPDNIKVNTDQKKRALADMLSLVASQGLVPRSRAFNTVLKHLVGLNVLHII